jgi:hypothetical protein
VVDQAPASDAGDLPQISGRLIDSESLGGAAAGDDTYRHLALPMWVIDATDRTVRSHQSGDPPDGNNPPISNIPHPATS